MIDESKDKGPKIREGNVESFSTFGTCPPRIWWIYFASGGFNFSAGSVVKNVK